MITVLQLQEAGARLLSGPETNHFTKVCIDSRQVETGALFVALPGERTDGHLFVEQAIRRGACGVLVSQKPQQNLEEVSVLYTDDCLKTLSTLACQRRQRLNPIVAAVTGSNGKTTTKDFLGAILKRKAPVLVTEGNFNNELGLPLTLLGLEQEHKYAVVEMGMRGRGQIRALCRLALPQLGIITNIGKSHLELLGSQEGIAQAKGELIECLPQEGIAILNGDDPRARNLKELHSGKTIFFGLDSDSDLWADEIRGRSFCLHYQEQSIEVTLPLYGKHNIENALAAAAAAVALDCSLAEIAQGLATAEISGQRLALAESPSGWLILDDTYNASPASASAALEVLAELAETKKRRPVAVLADMLELGAETVQLHRQVGALAAEQAKLLVTVGELGKEIAAGALAGGMEQGRVHSFENNKAAQSFLNANLKADDLVLLKGSRAMALEQLAAALQGREEA